MKSLHDQIANKCRHFNGLMNDQCEAGVFYGNVKQPREPGKGYALPCFKEDAIANCASCSFKTEEEIAAQLADYAKRFEGTMVARKAIVDFLGGPWKKGMAGSQGTIDCPVCKKGKSLHFSRAGYNGHIHAQCETKDCVSWME